MSNKEQDKPSIPVIKDSGKREQFSTGSIRDIRAGKGRFDLLPYPALLRVARHYEGGAMKYSSRNWEKGQPFSRVADSAMRHLAQWIGGQRDEDHLAACAWNCFAIMAYEHWIETGVLPQSLNDMPLYKKMYDALSDDMEVLITVKNKRNSHVKKTKPTH